jgi:hypothetical protein
MIYGEGSAVYRSNVKHYIWTHCNFLSCFVKPIYRATVSVKLEEHHIGGVMVSVLSSSAVDRGLEPRSGQIKDYKIGMCCFSAKYAALRSKSKD